MKCLPIMFFFSWYTVEMQVSALIPSNKSLVLIHVQDSINKIFAFTLLITGDLFELFGFCSHNKQVVCLTGSEIVVRPCKRSGVWV